MATKVATQRRARRCDTGFASLGHHAKVWVHAVDLQLAARESISGHEKTARSLAPKPSTGRSLTPLRGAVRSGPTNLVWAVLLFGDHSSGDDEADDDGACECATHNLPCTLCHAPAE